MPVSSRLKAPRRSSGPSPAAAPFRRILCPVDFSPFSREAIDHAVALARRCGAEITAVFVFPLAPPEGGASGAETDPGVRATVAKDLSELLEPARAAGVRVALSLETGDAAEAILAKAATMSADVIVMATHGRSGLNRWVLGSVTDQVLRRAECPVLTVAPSTSKAARHPGGLRILCALDLTEGSLQTADTAFALARATEAPVTLLHVVEDAAATPPGPAVAGRVHRLREIAVAHGEPPGDEVVVRGRPRREILRLARHGEAGLVVIGAHGHEATSPCLGSTTQYVVRHAGVPVLTVRGPEPRTPGSKAAPGGTRVSSARPGTAPAPRARGAGAPGRA
jgi:nucleotide-binding universal stress UspA family protein